MKTLFALILFFLISQNYIYKNRLERIKEFTHYVCVPGVIEHCNERTVVIGSFRYFTDQEYQDSILNLTKYK